MKRTTGYGEANDKQTEMTSLTDCTAIAVKDGYIENFKVERGRLCGASGKGYAPSDISVKNFYRFEGDSDPGDNSILYLIEANDGTKGMLINGFGAYADENISRFMLQVEDISKKQLE